MLRAHCLHTVTFTACCLLGPSLQEALSLSEEAEALEEEARSLWAQAEGIAAQAAEPELLRQVDAKCWQVLAGAGAGCCQSHLPRLLLLVGTAPGSCCQAGGCISSRGQCQGAAT